MPALDGVTLTVAPGERVALLGPNGGGKTTLFRVVTTLLRPDAGTASVFGHDVVAESAAARARLGVVFQTVALDGVLTVRENLGVHGALAGLRGAALHQSITDALAAVGLTDRASARVATLSGGLARRADLARVLMHRPNLLLLDEPTVGLDPTARRELWATLDDARRAGMAQLVATHLLDEAEACDRVVILDRGRIVADDTPAALTARLGADALWLETPDAEAVAADLRKRLGLDARPVGRRVLVAADDPAGVLPAVYAAPGVVGATVRRPSLDDVFAAATGGGALSPAP